jgi:hypothetical protein
MLQNNQQITIRETVGEDPVYLYKAPESGKIFATEKNLNYHYSQDRRGEKRNRSIIVFRKLFQTLEFDGRQERMIPEQRSVEEASQQLSGEEVVQVRRCEEMRLRIGTNPLQLIPSRQVLELERAVRYKKERKRKFRRKHKEHSDKMSLEVSMPQMTQEEMLKIKVRLADLFKTEINLIMREFKSRTVD